MPLFKIFPIHQGKLHNPRFVAFNTTKGTLRISTIQTDEFSNNDLEQLKVEVLSYLKYSSSTIKLLGVGTGILLSKNQLIYNQEEDFYRTDFMSSSLNSFLQSFIEVYDIEISATLYTPKVKAIMNSGFLKFSGEAFHSYTSAFYVPIISWLEQCLQLHRFNTFLLEFWMTYFNDTTARRFIQIMKILQHYKIKTQLPVKVHFYCELRDMETRESAEELIEDFPHLDGSIYIVDSLDHHVMNK